MARWKRPAPTSASENERSIAILTEKSDRWEADKAATQLLPEDSGRFSRWLYNNHPNPYTRKIKALTTLESIRKRSKR
jgi:hypothetical protein